MKRGGAWRWHRAMGGLVLVGLLTGCAGSGLGGLMSPEQQLRSRPSFEHAGREYIAMLDEMRRGLSEVVPSLTWRTAGAAEDLGKAGCREPFAGIDGSISGYYDTGAALGGISDADWPRAVAVVTEIGKRYGFVTIVNLGNKPGNHVISVSDGRGAKIEFGSIVDTTLAVFGACFLEESVLRSGSSPSPSLEFRRKDR